MNISPYNFIIEKKDNRFVIFNTYSGAIFELEEEIYELYANSNIGYLNSTPYYDALLDLGFFTSIKEGNNANTTLTIVISVTEACNLNCYYCFEKKVLKKETNNKIYSDILELVNAYLSSHDEIYNVNIIWFGGEPLIEADKIIKMSHELIELCDDSDIEYSASIISNGTLFTDSFIEYIDDLRIKKVQITIDGCVDKFIENKKGNMQLWNQFNNSLQKLINNSSVRLRINIDKDNISSVKQYLKELENLGLLNQIDFSISKIETSCLSKQLSLEEFYLQKIDLINYLLNELRYTNEYVIFKDLSSIEVACQIMSKNAIVIDSNGQCHKCEDDVGLLSHILVNDIENCINEISADNIVNDYTCKECVIYPLCRGGCPKHWDKKYCHLKIKFIKELASIKYNYSI